VIPVRAIAALRSCSGLVILAFLTTHFANHALGLVSLDAAEAGRDWFLTLWRARPMSVLLYTAFTVHAFTALRALYSKPHLKMPAWEATQLTLGLAIPFLLIPHVVGTRLAHTAFGVTDSYARFLAGVWHLFPLLALRQVGLVVLAWTHGCVGVHFWLRLRPGYPRVAPALLATAVLLPVLALLGFAEAGREVDRLARDPGWIAGVFRITGSTPAVGAALEGAAERGVAGYALVVGGVLVARAVRETYRRRWRSVRIRYPDGRTVTVAVGVTVLEASRLAGIPHASVCGGRGRCSTCRVRIGAGLAHLPPANRDELRLLRRIGAAVNVRLACQLRPERDVSVVPLLAASAAPPALLAARDTSEGWEQEVVVLFADLRGFTTLAENKLPYDLVFVLNRYFETVGRAIKQAGGVAAQFTGDGVMALFGVRGRAADAARQALAAAHAVTDAVAALGRELEHELRGPLRIGIGVHAGPAVVGRMGYEDSVSLTAVGDTVNVASRMEELTKEYNCELVFSAQVAAHAGIDASGFPRHAVPVRNRDAPVTVYVVERTAMLAGLDLC
jgi:adenylate cyclase